MACTWATIKLVLFIRTDVPQDEEGRPFCPCVPPTLEQARDRGDVIYLLEEAAPTQCIDWHVVLHRNIVLCHCKGLRNMGQAP